VTDARFFGILALFAISLLVIGFVLGWTMKDERSD
jgi:hypothetical protein